MNSIDKVSNEIKVIPATEQGRRSPFTLDELYIKCYTENPARGKQAALLAAGFTGANPAQRAFQMHQRLKRQINEVLAEKMNAGIHVGQNVLIELAVGAESESVRAASASKLIEHGIKYQPPAEQKRTKAELEKSIEGVQARLKLIRSGSLS